VLGVHNDHSSGSDEINCEKKLFCNSLEFFESIDAFLGMLDDAKANLDVWIIGGAELYNSFLKRQLVEYALITQVRDSFYADKFIDRSMLSGFDKRCLIKHDGYHIHEYFFPAGSNKKNLL
jgi:dihydrofolate reductase